jgi:glycosyltransferase involved in cell wall biosynthesis
VLGQTEQDKTQELVFPGGATDEKSKQTSRQNSISRLHWICALPTHYHNFFFHTLVQDPEIDLTVHFMRMSLSSHPWKLPRDLGFPARPYQKFLLLDWSLLWTPFKDENCLFVIAGWHEPTTIALINVLMVLGKPFVLWTDTPNLHRQRNTLKRVLRERWLRKVFSRARFVMGTGKPALEALEKMGCPRSKLVKFPFVVDLNSFAPVVKSLDHRKMTLLSSGRLVNSHKGYDVALKALAKVEDSLGAVDYTYRIAGTGPDKESLLALVQQLRLQEKVGFVGWLEPEDLPNFYRSGEIFLHSSHFDPYPNAVLEAMASGLTVIGSDAAGSVIDRIQHGQNGLIHRDGDVDDLAEKLIYALTHPDACRQMGSAARKTAEQWPVKKSVEVVKNMLHLVSELSNDGDV